MWIDRLDQRMDRWTESVPHLPLVLAVLAAVIVAELAAFGWVTLGQVERSHAREVTVASLRANIAQCYAHPNGAMVDTCRARALALASGRELPDGGPLGLPKWRGDERGGLMTASMTTDAQSGSLAQTAALVPVSLMPALR